VTKSWVSGGRSSDSIDKLRIEISDLERQRDELVEANKRRIFEWGSLVANSSNRAPVSSSADARYFDQEVTEILAKYNFLNQSILDKEMLLNEKLDEQSKLDSLG
jgi:hypothetical protein